MSGQVVAVASGKGGVGKTTTVVNLGVVLRRADHSVAMVDADLGMANLGPMLGVTAEHTLHDVLAGEATVEEALVEEAPGFGVLAGSSELSDYPDAAPEALGGVLETLAESYDFVLVDTGAGMSHEDVLPLGLADRVLLVTTPDPAAIGDTRKTAQLAELAEGTVAGLVVTKAEADTDPKHVAREVGVSLLGAVPYDATVRRSTASAQPLEAVDPDTPAAVAYRELADALADGSADPLKGEPSAGELGDASEAEADADPEPIDEPAPSAAPGADEGEPEPADVGATSPDPEQPAEPSGTEDGTPTADETGSTGGDDEAPAAEEAETTESDDEAAEVDEAPAEGAETSETVDDEAVESDETPDEEEEAETEPEDDESDEDADEAETEPEDDESDEEEEEDYLAEWEDDEPERSGGILARIGRIFR